jgi:hypothetical protein
MKEEVQGRREAKEGRKQWRPKAKEGRQKGRLSKEGRPREEERPGKEGRKETRKKSGGQKGDNRGGGPFCHRQLP